MCCLLHCVCLFVCFVCVVHNIVQSVFYIKLTIHKPSVLCSVCVFGEGGIQRHIMLYCC